MKLKMAADRVLKRFWRENRKEDASKEASHFEVDFGSNRSQTFGCESRKLHRIAANRLQPERTMLAGLVVSLWPPWRAETAGQPKSAGFLKTWGLVWVTF
jgi:hypothetical protein